MHCNPQLGQFSGFFPKFSANFLNKLAQAQSQISNYSLC